MNIIRLGTLAIALTSAALLTGCVVAPADGVYYGGGYSTYASPGYSYGYPYGGASLVIESSPTYVYGGSRPYYRPGGNYRPNYGHGGTYRPGAQSSRPPSVSPGAGAIIGRPIGSGGSRPGSGSAPSGRPTPGYQQVKPPQWQR